MESADIIIIGAGPGGYTTGAEAANDGKKVIVIERDELGGTCLNRGCIPTKALCRSAEVADMLRDAAEFGISTDALARPDFGAAVRRKDDIVATLREGVAEELSKVRIIKGNAIFTAPDKVSVDGAVFSAPQIIIATGSKPASLAIEGAELAVTSDYLLSADKLPQSAIVIGGGVIGMEFASILTSFGVKVTVIEYCKEILPPFDAEIAKRLRMAMKRRGVNIITSAEVKRISGEYTVTYETKGKLKDETAGLVLMAVGRKPVLPDGLTELGVELTRNAIKVDENMQSSVPGIYAIGDVNGLCMLAHAASAQGRVAIGKKQRLDVMPSAVFTSPECAMVGLTEARCQEMGLKFGVGKATFRANGKALAMGEPDGLVKLIYDSDNRHILGCHICGAHAADLIQEATLAMTAGLTIDDIADTIHAHPTLGEVLHTAAANLR